MLAFLIRHRLHFGLIALRSASIGVLVIAGGTIATETMDDFPAAVLLGGILGFIFGLAIDQAAVTDGRRQGRREMQDHASRQAEARRRHDAGPGRDRHADSRHNVARDLPPLERAGVTAGAALAATTFAQATAAVSGNRAAHGLADHPLDPSLEAIAALRDLMLGTLRAEELVGQQGRGVIQLAHELGPRVPTLDPETVIDYITDHVLVAAGQDPEQPQRWHGALDLVEVLPDPTGGADVEVTDAQLLGVDQAAEAPFLDLVVHVISHGGTGLGLGQLGVVLGTRGYRVSPYVLAGVAKYLIDQGRIQRPAGAWRYTLTDAEIERGAAAGGRVPADQRLPLEMVFSALLSSEDRGMAVAEVRDEVGLRLGRACTLGATVAALDALVRAGRASARDGRFYAINPLAESLISGPGLRERIRTAVTGAPDGLTLAELTEAVDADGFNAGVDRVRDMAAELIRHGHLVVTDGRYQDAPF